MYENYYTNPIFSPYIIQHQYYTRDLFLTQYFDLELKKEKCDETRNTRRERDAFHVPHLNFLEFTIDPC